MKKILLGLVIASASLSAVAADLVSECQDYYKQADSVLESSLEAAKAQGMDTDTLRKQYEDSKNQVAALPEAQQKMACEQAKAALEQATKAQAAQ